MPNYDYTCKACNQKTEVFQKISDAPLKTCPHCNKDALVRGPGGGIGLQFQGTGFYITDYPASTPSKDSKQDSASSTSSNPACCPCGKQQSCSTEK